MRKPWNPLVRYFGRLLLIDILLDRESRRIFLWVLATLLVGTFVYHRLEGWSWGDSFYFCVVTLSTVGYGDLAPTRPITKVLTSLYILNGIGVLLALFDRLRVVRERRIREGGWWSKES